MVFFRTILLLALLALPVRVFASGTIPGTSSAQPHASLFVGGSLYSIFLGLLGWMVSIVFFIAVLSFGVGSLFYMTARGNEDQQTDAKDRMWRAFWSVVYALAGYVAIHGMLNLVFGGTVNL